MGNDVIDELIGVAPGSSLDAIRARRPQARINTERSYRELFEPQNLEGLPLRERLAVAAFVSSLHRAEPTAKHYADLLEKRINDEVLAGAVAEAAASAFAHGPYGHFHSAALKSEGLDGLIWRPDVTQAVVFGPRLAAALAHAHLLTLRPRDATSDSLQVLLDAGLSTTEIVTLSQIVAFLSFQIRIVEGLRLLAV